MAAAALAAGADMVNDITGFRHDAAMARLVAERGAAAVVMHNQRGRTTKDVIGDIAAGLRASLCLADGGIPAGRIVLDPGFGFGWTPEREPRNAAAAAGAVGARAAAAGGRRHASRRWGRSTGLPVDQRLEASLASAAIAVAGGADIIRVHDVAETVRAVRVADAIVRGTWRAPA